MKKNGRREPFEREKLERSLTHALRKRPVEAERVDRMITGIVRNGLLLMLAGLTYRHL